MEFLPQSSAAVDLPAPSPGAFDQDAPHGRRRRREEVTPAAPAGLELFPISRKYASWTRAVAWSVLTWLLVSRVSVRPAFVIRHRPAARAGRRLARIALVDRRKKEGEISHCFLPGRGTGGTGMGDRGKSKIKNKIRKKIKIKSKIKIRI